MVCLKRTSDENYSVYLMKILICPWIWISSVFKATKHKFSPFGEQLRGTICDCDYSCCQIFAVGMMYYFFPYWWYRWKPLLCKSFRICVGAVAYQRSWKLCMHLDKGFALLQPELCLIRAGFDHFLFLQSLVWRNPSSSKACVHPELCFDVELNDLDIIAGIPPQEPYSCLCRRCTKWML